MKPTADTYKAAIRRTWRHSAGPIPGRDALLRELVRYASLAPSSHNTQCWKFQTRANSIRVLADFSRRCPVVDPDDHHLYVSLGCAIENLILAARAFGLSGEPSESTGPETGFHIDLQPAAQKRTALFEAIPERQCTRTVFDHSTLKAEELRHFKAAGTGDGVRVLLLTERAAMEEVLEAVVEGNTAQMKNPAFVRELVQWLRFNDFEAITKGDGLFARTSGNPTIPRWFGRLIFPLVFRVKPENDRYAAQIRSSAGIAVFVSDRNEPRQWTEVGRCYQRFALQAAALDVRTAFINQPVEESNLRPHFAVALGIGTGRPDLVVRFGRGRKMPQSLRRPVETVLE